MIRKKLEDFFKLKKYEPFNKPLNPLKNLLNFETKYFSVSVSKRNHVIFYFQKMSYSDKILFVLDFYKFVFVLRLNKENNNG